MENLWYVSTLEEAIMILGAAEIIRQRDAGNIIIEPFNREQLKINSYDLSLGSELLEIRPNAHTDSGRMGIDPRKKPNHKKIKIGPEGYWIQPGHLYLGYTLEKAGSTARFVPMLTGRSSFGRLNVAPHLEAGFGDVGFDRQWTLEIFCVAYPILLFPGIRICQAFWIDSTWEQGDPIYATDGHYPVQSGATPSKWYSHQDGQKYGK